MADQDRTGLLRRLGREAAIWLGLVLDHCKPIRVSLLVLAVAAVGIFNIDQVAELFLIAMWADPSRTRYLWLLGTSALTGLAVWYTARHAYRLTYPRWPALQNPRAEPLRRWLPRALGIAVPLLVLVGYLVALRAVPHSACGVVEACRRRDGRTAGLLIEAAAMIAFFIGRRRLLDGRGGSAARRVTSLAALGAMPLRLFIAVLILNVLMTGLVAWQPHQFDRMGALSVAQIAGSFLCMSGGFLCMLADRRGVPLITLMALLAVGLHAARLNDNHRVRQYPAMSTHQRPAPPPPDTRPDFDAYASAWLHSRCLPQQTCPVIVVSAEGGGVRSAAWTAMVLGRFTALVGARQPASGDEPLFERYLFAGSGVSGGSLGLATYVAALKPEPRTGVAAQARSEGMLDHDFLAPVMANAWFIDFTQRWLPGAWLNDRGRALTHTWEQAAQEQGMDAFAQPFAALYEHRDGSMDTDTPALFLNSTVVASGWRFVQDPFRPFARSPWNTALDGSRWLDPRVPLSEVVLNSARFTYVGPAGTLQTARAAGSRRTTLPTLQLVDGGYFENSGTATLREVMQRLRTIAKGEKQPLRFIVLHISNDPSLHDFVAAHDPHKPLPWYSAACPRAPRSSEHTSYGEATAPLVALLDTRDARGEFARARLLASLHEDPGDDDVLWHMRLCPGDYPMPMGWTISRPVFNEMDRQLKSNYPMTAMATWLAQQLHEAKEP